MQELRRQLQAQGLEARMEFRQRFGSKLRRIIRRCVHQRSCAEVHEAEVQHVAQRLVGTDEEEHIELILDWLLAALFEPSCGQDSPLNIPKSITETCIANAMCETQKAILSNR